MRHTILIAAALVSVGFAEAGFAARKGIQVADVGKDGPERFYAVVCTDGRPLTLYHHYKEHRVCYVREADKPPICLNGDNVDAVAARACRDTK